MMKKVSIIIPVYNVEKYLNRCFESVIRQTYRNIEVILVDDGSPDNCPLLCDQLARSDDRVSVIHKNNGGLSSARLAGFDIASGEYILFVDSDDYISPTMVGTLVQSIENSNADIAMCAYTRVEGEDETAQYLPYTESLLSGREKIEGRYILPLMGCSFSEISIPGFLCIRLLKKSLIQRFFFGSERKYFMEDHVFDLLYADGIEKISIVNEPLYYYCVNRASLSNRYIKDKWTMYENLYDFYCSYALERKIEYTSAKKVEYIAAAVFSCIDNAVLSGNYVTYRRELSKIRNSKLYIKQMDSSKLTKMQKLIKILFDFHADGLLFIIRKLRLKQAYK